MPRQPQPTSSRFALILTSAIFCLLVSFGFAVLQRYSSTSGTPGRVPAIWPSGTDLERDSSKPTLLVLVHPQCPCTRATIAELDRIVARCEGRLSTRVLFVAVSSLEADELYGGLWSKTKAIPGVVTLVDSLGRTAAAFGSFTSGQAVLYAPDGKLLFEGGITGARGHEGDNAGAQAVVDLVLGRGQCTIPIPHFDESIHEDDRIPEEELELMGWSQFRTVAVRHILEASHHVVHQKQVPSQY